MADVKEEKVTEKLYLGKYKLSGVDGRTGKKVSFEAEIPMQTTIDGAFHIAQGHYALLRRDGFAAEEVKEPEAEKAKP